MVRTTEIQLDIFYVSSLYSNGDVWLRALFSVFSWGEGGDEGKLGHGDRLSYDKPKLIEALSGISVIDIACGSGKFTWNPMFSVIYTHTLFALWIFILKLILLTSIFSTLGMHYQQRQHVYVGKRTVSVNWYFEYKTNKYLKLFFIILRQIWPVGARWLWRSAETQTGGSIDWLSGHRCCLWLWWCTNTMYHRRW